MHVSVPEAVPAQADLRQGFRDPPLSARPAVYWAWVNGLTDKRQMTRELEELKAKGIGGVYIFDVGAQDPQKIVPAGPAFMGPESLQAIGHAVREATRLGLEVGLVTSSSWNCGGPWIPPEYASMGLYHCRDGREGAAAFLRSAADAARCPRTRPAARMAGRHLSGMWRFWPCPGMGQADCDRRPRCDRRSDESHR